MYNRKKSNLTSIIGWILIVLAIIAIIGCGIAAAIFYFQNPDMTELRRFIEYPAPSIIALVAVIAVFVGNYLISRS